MKNVSVEYAEKAAPGGEIDKSIKELKDIPVLTEDNAKEIFEKRPKFINYNDEGIYYLCYANDEFVCYTYANGEERTLTTINIEANGVFEVISSGQLALKEQAGSKLYKHQVIVPYVYTSAKLIQDSTGSTTYEKGPVRSSSTFTFVSTDNTPATDLYTLYDEMVRAFRVVRGHDPIYPDRTYGAAPTYTEIVLKTKNSTSYYDGTNTLTPVYIIDSNSTVTDTVTPL